MKNIKRFAECLVPGTVCNLNCSYCYTKQEGRRKRTPYFKYTPEYMGKALSKDRLGGICYISMCAAGETLFSPKMPEIIKCILRQGHYVNITTNGTLNQRFDEILKLVKPEELKRLHFAFSFHYLELVRTNKIDDFFDNVKKMRNSGCSFLIQLNLCDEYIPYLKEIKKICEKNTGAPPQLAATRNERTKKITLMTKYKVEEYKKFGDMFKSPLFDFTMKNFMVKRKEFCYAGDWAFKLYLDTGEMRKCYGSRSTQNIFKDLNKPIRFKAIGNNCKSPYCINSSHFLSLGVIPGISTPSYAELRDRPQAQWYNPEMKAFLNTKLFNNNEEYNSFQKLQANIEEFLTYLIKASMGKIKLLMKNHKKL
jgi:organic radical activating enzyme